MSRHHPHQDIIIIINAADQGRQLEQDIRPACRCCYSHPFLFILRWHYKTCIHCEQMFFLVSFFACLFFRCSIKFHFILRPYYRTGIHCENMCACPLVHVKSNPQFSTKHFLGSEANRASQDFCGAGIGMFWFPTILDTSGPESFHRARIGKIENYILLTNQDKWRK